MSGILAIPRILQEEAKSFFWMKMAEEVLCLPAIFFGRLSKPFAHLHTFTLAHFPHLPLVYQCRLVKVFPSPFPISFRKILFCYTELKGGSTEVHRVFEAPEENKFALRIFRFGLN